MKKTFEYVSSDKGDMEQQKIRKTFSERQVNVEMEWGDIGIKKNKKNIGGADSRQNWPIHHKKKRGERCSCIAESYVAFFLEIPKTSFYVWSRSKQFFWVPRSKF